MKKFILFLFVLLFVPLFSSAKELTLQNKIISFQAEDGYGLQGFIVLKDKLFLVLVGPNDLSSQFKVFDLKTKKEIYSAYYKSVGHANDVAYNSKENIIYIIHASGSDIIYPFDGNDYTPLPSFSIKFPIRSITYIEERDQYAVRLITVGYLLDSHFNRVSSLPFITGMNINEKVGRQGWSYYNHFLWYVNWSWIRLGGDGTNDIMVYDLEGNKLEDFLTNATYGEMEDIAFYQDKMLLGFNSYEGKITFYLEPIPEVHPYVPEEIVPFEVEKKRFPWEYMLLIFFFVSSLFLVRKKKIFK